MKALLFMCLALAVLVFSSGCSGGPELAASGMSEDIFVVTQMPQYSFSIENAGDKACEILKVSLDSETLSMDEAATLVEPKILGPASSAKITVNLTAESEGKAGKIVVLCGGGDGEGSGSKSFSLPVKVIAPEISAEVTDTSLFGGGVKINEGESKIIHVAIDSKTGIEGKARIRVTPLDSWVIVKDKQNTELAKDGDAYVFDTVIPAMNTEETFRVLVEQAPARGELESSIKVEMLWSAGAKEPVKVYSEDVSLKVSAPRK